MSQIYGNPNKTTKDQTKVLTPAEQRALSRMYSKKYLPLGKY